MGRKVVIVLLVISILGVALYIAAASRFKVHVIHVPQAVEFTNEYNPDAYMCFPAAYTSTDGKILGEYRINGKTYGNKNFKERISLHPKKGMIIHSRWRADNGFQQHVLVKDKTARPVKDTRKCFRRALCNETAGENTPLIIMSLYPMTLSEFAQELAKHCDTAVNLDMGDFGYGWKGKIRYSLWAYYNKDSQTNWICIDKAE